jgi:hypothetical protein
MSKDKEVKKVKAKLAKTKTPLRNASAIGAGAKYEKVSDSVAKNVKAQAAKRVPSPKMVKPPTIKAAVKAPAVPKTKIVKPSTLALKSTTAKTPIRQAVRSVKQTMKPTTAKGIAKLKSMAKPAPKNVRPAAAKTIKKSGPKR